MPLANVSGRKLYYETHGDFEAPGARPLVLVMGMAGSCRGWLPLQVPDFAPTRPVLIFDHRGVGQSDDDGRAFTTADLARDTVGLLDALELEKVDLLGTFMGGMTAQEIALLAPDRLGKLILVGTYARADAKRRMLLEHWSELVQMGASSKVFIGNRLLWTLQDETIEQSDLIQSMTEFYAKEGAPYSADLFARQCRACSEHDTSDRLGALPHSTLIVCGRHDILTPPRLHRELADLIPDSRLVTMSYGGHLVMVESVERFNQIVLQFLDDER
ncbi:MAG: alpha/beta fold hydrolase [Deltaproteobacteria bacterium]|nr:alpha/beta fold hydrolase [Deltaproteobacteria bacterium]MBW2384780.1 alpha/beta fold hydrolase [Deltaproteobacteria bacterium]MBW2697543.1 alpha/beta fold hydrolase [Deltaproteobacteria bacterium]